MHLIQATDLLGHHATDPDVESLLKKLQTKRRPELDSSDRDSLHDWILVRRKGIEFGFVDEVFFCAGEKFLRRRNGSLLLFQVYFFTQRDDISTYQGRLPYDLIWSDNRKEVRRKLDHFEMARRSYLKDTWDVPGYRMTVDYKKGYGAIDSIVCQIPIKPWPEMGRLQVVLTVADWLSLLGLPITSSLLQQRLHPLDIGKRILDSDNDREVDFTFECGVQLYFTESQRLKQITRLPTVRKKDLVLGAIQFFRSRELDARQWTGELPFGLSFDDTQDTMVSKMGCAPDKQEDDYFSGIAVWHFNEYSVEVLYNNIENHLLRVMLMSSGF